MAIRILLKKIARFGSHNLIICVYYILDSHKFYHKNFRIFIIL